MAKVTKCSNQKDVPGAMKEERGAEKCAEVVESLRIVWHNSRCEGTMVEGVLQLTTLHVLVCFAGLAALAGYVSPLALPYRRSLSRLRIATDQTRA